MSKNDSKLLTKVSSLIPGQVPDFVESDHSLFLKFLKDYYQYLEAGSSDGNAGILFQNNSNKNQHLDVQLHLKSNCSESVVCSLDNR